VLTGSPVVGQEALLRASSCAHCRRWEFPYRDYCPGCGGRDVVEGSLGPQARVVGTTAVLHPPPGAMVETPYTVALAAFAEGVSVLGVVMERSFDEVPLGAHVVATVVELDGRLGYQYRLDKTE
jgi:uncharacterized OB-fold protein